MANEEHLAILRQGVAVWNAWRGENPTITPDLSKAELQGYDLFDMDFTNANLCDARFMGADLRRARFNFALMRDVLINDARAPYADFSNADMRRAYLWGSDFREANFSGANLMGANLRCTQLVMTNFAGANLTNCKVYGLSAWDLKLNGASVADLIVSKPNEPEVTVDNLEVAQFVYMLLNNAKIRDVIDTIGKKAVLILGRFTDERKSVLEAIKNELRQRNYVPILFDFEKPASRDLTETIVTLAHLSRFVIADITDAKSIPQELQAIVPNLLSVPIQPIILAAQREYALFEHFRRYPSVLPLHEYASQDQLIAELPEKVIEPAERKVIELRG